MATVNKKAAKKKAKRKKKGILRKYKGPDSYLQEQSQTLRDLFEDDQPDFEALNVKFANPFEVDWQTAIDAAINYTDDTAVSADIQIKTVSVKAQIALCRKKYDEVIYFASVAFGKKGVELKAFGKGSEYRKAARSQAKLRNFMDELHQAAEKHKVKLLLAGYTQLKIDAIATLRDSFSTSNRDQNLLRKNRLEISQARVILYNTLYTTYVRPVVDAAKIIYADDPARLEQYSYNPPVKHRVPEEGLVFEGTLNPSEIANIPLENIQLVPTDIILMEATDSTFIFFAAADPGNGQAGPSILATEGAPQQRTAGDLVNELGVSDLKPYFNTQNTGMVTGTYKVTITRAA